MVKQIFSDYKNLPKGILIGQRSLHISKHFMFPAQVER